MGKRKEVAERDKLRERRIRWCDFRGLLVSSETSREVHESCYTHICAVYIHCMLIHTEQQHSRPNPPQPINKHLTGTEIQYREQH